MPYPTGLVEKLRNLAFEANFDEITSTLSFKVIMGASAERLIKAIAAIYEHDPMLCWKQSGQASDIFYFKMSVAANWPETRD